MEDEELHKIRIESTHTTGIGQFVPRDEIDDCFVTTPYYAASEGKVERGTGVCLIRDSVVIHEGKLSTLKRFKDEVREVPAGQEWGMAFENYQDIKQGGIIECFRTHIETRTL
jgi:hypothetical protein